jgi:hypothetical protein
MDLVGRKLSQAGGRPFDAFVADVTRFTTDAGERAPSPALAGDVQRLAVAVRALSASAAKVRAWIESGRMDMAALVANRFLEMMSEVAVGWLLLEGARIAWQKRAERPATEPDAAFYTAKITAASYYARNVLPAVEQKARQIEDEDRSALEMPDAGFATV